MWRVYALYVVRRLTSPTANLAVFAGAAFVIYWSVSLRDVVLNTLGAAQTPLLLVEYVASSFVKTEFSVQLFLVLVVVASVLVVRDAALLVTHLRRVSV